VSARYFHQPTDLTHAPPATYVALFAGGGTVPVVAWALADLHEQRDESVALVETGGVPDRFVVGVCLIGGELCVADDEPGFDGYDMVAASHDYVAPK
jgi:hypothetical protein